MRICLRRREFIAALGAADLRLVWHGKPRAEVIPEGDAELGALAHS
jgi:hypothetical protein